MSNIINWVNNRGLLDGDYLGNLCRNNHEYKNTGKSVRCKPTDRKNGKCVCCKKIQSDKHYLENKNYYKNKATNWNQTLEGRIYNREASSRQKFKDNFNYVEKILHKNIIARVNRFDNKCAYCGINLEILDKRQQNSLEIDHVVPKKNNGSHCLANIVPSCHSCNQNKKNKNMIEWYKNQPFYSKTILNKIQNVLNETSYPSNQLKLLHDWQI